MKKFTKFPRRPQLRPRTGSSTPPAAQGAATTGRPWRRSSLTLKPSYVTLGDDPYRQDADVKKLTGPSGLYRLRVGNHRVAYQINDGELVILVVKVGDRRDVNRNL